MTPNQPISMLPRRGARGDEERQARRFSLVVVAVVLSFCVAFIAWKLWVVETLRDRLEAMPVEVEAADNLKASVAQLRVVSHQGPGESAFFDLIVGLEVRRGPGEGLAVIRIDAELANAGGASLQSFEPIGLGGVRAGERRVVDLNWSPVPKPVAEGVARLRIWVR